MSNPDADVERLRLACETLSEHFDSVHIFVTRLNDEDAPGDRGTIHANYGNGNWFARYGQIRMWMTKQDEQSRKEQRDL